jgi:CO dehydrogenase nickel-insertion accessory protein CooC1
MTDKRVILIGGDGSEEIAKLLAKLVAERETNVIVIKADCRDDYDLNAEIVKDNKLNYQKFTKPYGYKR